MKTVSIITYYNANNYGAFLQGYSLMKFLRTNGFNASFMKMDVKVLLCDEAFSNEFERELALKLEEMQDYLQIDESVNEKYDYAIIGSDEVFNFNNQMYKNISCFDGSDIYADKIISYAASIGGAKYTSLIRKNFRRLLNLRKLDQVSVRDNRTKGLVKWFVGKNIKKDVDPTLLVDLYDEMVTPRESNYILVYTYGFTNEHVEMVKRFAAEKGLKIIATGSYCSWCDENLVVNPFEWLGLIKNSQYVFTSTFHGTIFALKYHKQFVALVNHAEKVKLLLNDIDEQQRYFRDTSYDEFVTLCDTPIDYVNLPLSNMIKASQRNLLDALK